MANKISVILEATTDKAVGALKNFKSAVGEADGAFGKIKAGGASAFDSIKQNAGLAAVGVVGAVGVMASKSIEAASRLGESVNAVNVTFGQSAAGIKDLGEQAAESVGLSNAAFNGLAVQFSSFAETIAGKGGDVVGTIDEMTTRAADFASVMNIDVAEAARLFQSGLAGETEPLKKFGIDLSAAAVEAHALATGMVSSKSEMTEAIKVQARYSLLMEETEKTAGDFANTSDSLANSQRILAAKTEDTAAKVGQKLAPALAQVTTMLSDVIPIAGDMAVGVGQAFEKMVDGAYEMGQTIADVWEALPFTDAPELIGPTLFEWEKLERATESLVEEFSKGSPTMDEFVAAMKAAGESTEAISLASIEYAKQLGSISVAGADYIEMQQGMTGALDDAGDALGDTTDDTDDLTGANKLLEDQIRKTEDAYSDLKGELNAEEDFLAAEGMWADLQQSAVDSYTAAGEGADDAAEKASNHAQKVIDAKQEVVDLGEKYRDLPEEEITRIVALIDEGQLAEAERRFNILTRNREMNISIIARGGAGYSTLPNFAGGGTVPGAMGSPQLIVAHGGEEIFDPRGGGHASTNGNGWAEGTMVNVQPGGIVLQGSNLTGRDVVEALAQYVRINGPAPLRKLTGG